MSRRSVKAKRVSSDAVTLEECDMAFGKLWVIAYRDLGRNRRRTIFTLIAVALGLALLVMLNGFIQGVWDDALQNNIRLNTGHVQLRADSYEEEKLSLKWEDLLENTGELAANANALAEVEAAAPVLRATAILNTIDDSVGLQVHGIDPASPLYEPIREGMVAGEFLSPDDRSGILIGKRLADDLGLEVGRDVNLSIVNADGQPDEGIFTIRGIFSTGVPSYDDNSVFMPLAKAQAFAATGDRASAIVMLLYDENKAGQVAAALRSPGTIALTWQEINQVLMQTFETGMGFYVILDAIVMLVVAVVIANTLLMSVFERIREVGILASLGMKSRQIMVMFLIEAAILGVAGIVVGLLLGSAGVAYLARVGMDAGEMSSVAEGIAMSSTMYARFVPGIFASLSLWTLLVIMLASLYPAWFAARLEPVDALHSL